MKGRRKIVIVGILMVMAVVILGVGIYYWYENTYYVSTEDAKVTGDIVRVSPQVSGKLVEYNLEEGQAVNKGQILARQEVLTMPEPTPEITVIRAPIAGIVLKEQGTLGELVSPGQVLGMMVAPEKIYITANIEETKLRRLQKGQQVEVHVDEFAGKKFKGVVDSIGQAATSVFSMLPTSTGGSFTKVIQKVPVKITLQGVNVKLLPGTNAVVKIHVK